MDTGATASEWYFAKQTGPAGGAPPQQAGPFTWEQLYQQAQTGALGPGDLIWNPQLPQWTPAGQTPGLFAGVAPSTATPAPTTAPVPASTLQPRPRKSILPWLIPLIALLVVGAGLGAYFGFFYDRDGSGGTAADGNGPGTSGAATSTTAPTTEEAPPLIDTLAAAPTIMDVRYRSTSFSVTADGGSSTIDSHGLVITVPEGAVAADTTIEIRTLAGPYHMEEGTEPTGPNGAVCVGPTYDFGPEGLHFDKPVTITLPYDESALPAGIPEENVTFAYWNGQEWIAHAGLIDTENNTLTVQLERFDGVILETTAAGVIIVGGIIIYTGKYIWDKLNDPERISTDAIMTGTAPDWITSNDPTVDSFAKTAVVKVSGDKDNPPGPSVPLSDPAALGRLLQDNPGKRSFISFPGKNSDGGDLNLPGRWSKDPSTNWQKPADYLTSNNARGDCTDVSNALVSILSNQGYPAKVVFGYAGDKNSPHVWVEVLVGDKPYFVDENGQFSPLTDDELKNAGLIRADPSDNRNAMWDEHGQEPYTSDWWQEYLEIDLNGKWTGTFTFTDIELSPEAQAELDKIAQDPPDELEGCDLSSLGAILEQLKGKPCPMSLDITTQEGGTGSAVLFIDFSALGEVSEPQEPAQVPLTWKDRTITISATEDGQVTTITGTAVKRGKEYVMNGTMTIVASQEGQMVYTLSGEWQTVKQGGGGVSW
ncbi:MAG: DUF4339 domain-containing protein [Thermoleophilia bacterium]|nr:DUF4339 domain-containing protein [Thermoleophilia bacterium]